MVLAQMQIRVFLFVLLKCNSIARQLYLAISLTGEILETDTVAGPAQGILIWKRNCTTHLVTSWGLTKTSWAFCTQAACPSVMHIGTSRASRYHLKWGLETRLSGLMRHLKISAVFLFWVTSTKLLGRRSPATLTRREGWKSVTLTLGSFT